MADKIKVSVLPLNEMRKVTEVIDRYGNVLSTTTQEPGTNKFEALAEKRRQRLGL